MTVTLAALVTEQRAVRAAELELDRAEVELIASVPTSGSLRAPKRQAARWRYQQALIQLQHALTVLHSAKCRAGGRRHLWLVKPQKDELSTSNHAVLSDTVR